MGGGLRDEVRRVRGEQRPDGGYSGTMYQILENCGFDTNHMIMTQNCTDKEAAALGGSVLRIPFDPQRDKFNMKITLTVVVEGKKRKKKVSVLTEEDIMSLKIGHMKLNKRMVLSLDCDTPVPLEERAAWTQFMLKVVNMEPIIFTRSTRSTRPKGAVGQPWVAGFCDGSLSAFSVLIYVLWTLPKDTRDGSDRRFKRKATLLMAKSRVAPVHGKIVPRMDM